MRNPEMEQLHPDMQGTLHPSDLLLHFPDFHLSLKVRQASDTPHFRYRSLYQITLLPHLAQSALERGKKSFAPTVQLDRDQAHSLLADLAAQYKGEKEGQQADALLHLIHHHTTYGEGESSSSGFRDHTHFSTNTPDAHDAHKRLLTALGLI